MSTPSIAPSVETRNDTITQSSAPESTDLYQSIRMQNQQIDIESGNMRDSYSTDKQRIKYMNYNIINWFLIFTLSSFDFNFLQLN